MKDISIIVPIYNVEKYIENCLLSLENQEFDSYEVILMDDGSTDNSKSIAEKFVKKNPDKFKLYSQENAGQSAARNNAIKYASGKYVCYVDSDDTIEANYLSALYEPIRENNVDLTFCALRTVDENGKCLKEFHESKYQSKVVYNIMENHELFLMHNSPCNKLFRKDIIVDNKLTFPERVWAEDLRFTKKYLSYTSKSVYVDLPLYNYYQRSGSTLHSMKTERTSEILTALDDVSQFYTQRGIFEIFRDEIEMLAIEDIYIYTMVKLVRANEMEQLKVIRDEFLKRYPNHNKNKYISQLGKNRRIIYELLNRKQYGLIKLIFMIKG